MIQNLAKRHYFPGSSVFTSSVPFSYAHISFTRYRRHLILQLTTLLNKTLALG